MTDREIDRLSKSDDDALRVLTRVGPLGTERITVREIGRAEGFVFCRHRSQRPVAVSEEEWQALPVADGDNYDV